MRFLTQFFSYGLLRDLQKRRHFCQKTFRESGGMAVCESLTARETCVLLQRKELCQTSQKCAAFAFRLLKRANGYASGNANLFDDQHLVANQFQIVTKEVVETARQNLIIGPD